jgi:hypothetical protein
MPETASPAESTTRGGKTSRRRRKGRDGARSSALIRQQTTLHQAVEEGLLGGQKDSRVTGRVPRKLIEAARARTSLSSDTDLLTYALAKVALEDDFGDVLLSLQGSVSPEIDLEF